MSKSAARAMKSATSWVTSAMLSHMTEGTCATLLRLTDISSKFRARSARNW
eukprot:CAMPEP_0173197822 /NCGR_PEP_ID=MMETSP1141-20130122/16364_1 /TAXON_ID=483371 /ORGANISM="non described non described, Strain CCMP2298" /LENGTH=50 /DNA_ID=CAMNT_0014122585 /DNA_START=947 /DNA_END=1096 /DNA_ORIENTATION=-